MSNVTAKRLYVRMLANGKLSVGEYLRAKWFNVVNPFIPKNAVAQSELRRLVMNWTAETKRPVVVEGYRGDSVAEGHARNILQGLIE